MPAQKGPADKAVVARYELFGWMSTIPNIYHCAAIRKRARGGQRAHTPTTTVVVVFLEVKRVIKGLKV